jgi:ATP-dependent RNA helicase DDX18/HAS1
MGDAALSDMLWLQPVVFVCCVCAPCRLLQAVAKSFGFSGPPKVSLNIESKAAHGRRAKKGQQGAGGADYRRTKGKPSSGHAFSASNPYGLRAKGDNRQLARF